MKKGITQREAKDVYHAQLIAQGMENAGADVFSIVSDTLVYQVFCRHNKTLSADKIDKEIEKTCSTSSYCI
ncbi:MAG: hypothetical protein AB1632_08740 [Nitrospirota bacterium]